MLDADVLSYLEAQLSVLIFGLFDYLPMNLNATKKVRCSHAGDILIYFTRDVRSEIYKWSVWLLFLWKFKSGNEIFFLIPGGSSAPWRKSVWRPRGRKWRVILDPILSLCTRIAIALINRRSAFCSLIEIDTTIADISTDVVVYRNLYARLFFRFICANKTETRKSHSVLDFARNFGSSLE